SCCSSAASSAAGSLAPTGGMPLRVVLATRRQAYMRGAEPPANPPKVTYRGFHPMRDTPHAPRFFVDQAVAGTDLTLWTGSPDPVTRCMPLFLERDGGLVHAEDGTQRVTDLSDGCANAERIAHQ